jgi:hypothetical protein
VELIFGRSSSLLHGRHPSRGSGQSQESGSERLAVLQAGRDPTTCSALHSIARSLDRLQILGVEQIDRVMVWL